MELRQLQAFEAVAAELHFGRAARRLFMSQPALSEQVRSLERELGTALFHRTSRRVELTPAGVELLGRARAILSEVGEASAAVRRFGEGAFGSLRLGVTPLALPVLAPHLIAALADVAPGISVELRQMWLWELYSAVVTGVVDVGVTPGYVQPPDAIQMEQFCREPLLAGLRPSHHHACRSHVSLHDLADQRLGQPPEALFPAWVKAQRAVLESAGVDPPMAPLLAADLSAARWLDQPEIDWVLLTPSLSASHDRTMFVCLYPPQYLHFCILWLRSHRTDPVVERFLKSSLSAALPAGWMGPSRGAGALG